MLCLLSVTPFNDVQLVLMVQHLLPYHLIIVQIRRNLALDIVADPSQHIGMILHCGQFMN